MTTIDINTEINEEVIAKLLEERFNEAWERVKTFKHCRSMYGAIFMRFGFEYAEFFKLQIILTAMVNPEWGDMDCLRDFVERINERQEEMMMDKDAN